MLKSNFIAIALLTTFDAVALDGYYRTEFAYEVAAAWRWFSAMSWTGVFF